MTKYIKDKNGRYEFPVDGLLISMLDNYNEDSGMDCTYNLTVQMGLYGKLDIARMEKAFNRIIAENDSLRASFSKKGNEYFIRIRESYELSLSITNIDGDTKEDRKKEAYKQAKIVSDKAIDVYNSVGFMVDVLKIDEDEHLMVMNFHHALSDGTTLGILIATLLEYYKNEEVVFPKSSGTFLEYINEEYEFLNSDLSKEEKKFWEDKFESYKPSEYTIDENEELTESCLLSHILLNKDELTAIAKKNKTSLFNIVVTIYLMAISKIEGRNDVALSYLLAARNNPKYKTTYGFITRPTNIRYTFSNEEKFEDIHKRIRMEIAKGVSNYRTSSPYVRDGYILAYQNQNDGMELPVFEGKPIDLSFAELKRTPYWMVIRINEDGSNIVTSNECDTRKHSKEYLEKLRLASIQAQEFLVSKSQSTFGDFINISKEDNQEEAFVMF